MWFSVCTTLYSEYDSTRLLSEHTVSRAPNESHYNKKSVFHTDVKAQNHWLFGVGVKTGIYILNIVYVVFQERVSQDKQQYFKDVIVELPVSCAKCNLWADKYAYSGLISTYDADFCSQVSGEKVSSFRH